jgi:hypothetical protein
MPPEGYEVKRSTCTHYIEGDAKLLNNSRVVRIASDGTVPLQRAEPLGNPDDDFRRVVVAKVPNKLLGGEGRLARAVQHDSDGFSAPHLTVASASGSAPEPESEENVSFVKLGQMVLSEEPDGSTVQWVVSSDPLGDPVRNDRGQLEYQATCFRDPNVTGHDTAGYTETGTELAKVCMVEDLLRSWNAVSAEYGVLANMNYTTMAIPSLNDPQLSPTVMDIYKTYLGERDGLFWYTGLGAALNDINGAERNSLGEYYPWEIYCHVIVNGGLEVPAAKRPATKSLPAPGVVNGHSYIEWRPVNLNVDIANNLEPVPPLELQPELAEVPVEPDAIGPL